MNQSNSTKHLSRGKRLLFIFITVLLVWLSTDTFAYVALHYLGKTKNIFFAIHPATSDNQISRWYSSTPFHASWGFDISPDLQGRYGSRRGREYQFMAQYQIKVFGDSFAFGAGMKDSETFESQVEEKSGWECLNYGVVGYGTDQALLKYIDNKISTRYTVLTILDENIERCLTVCRGLLTPRMALKPKPRFEIAPDGSIILLENPLRSKSDLVKLKSISFLESLKEHDYWAKYYERLNAPSKLVWPATYTIVSHLDYFLSTAAKHARFIVSPSYETHLERWPHNHLYEKGSEGLKVLTYIIDKFVETAVSRGENPVILVFPKRETMEIIQKFGKKPYNSLLDFLETRNFHFIDMADSFVEKDWTGYYITDGHYSKDGNRIIAEKLVRLIRDIDESLGTE